MITLAKRSFLIVQLNNQLSSLSAANVGTSAAPPRIVPLVTLDSELEKWGWDRVSVLKIDVEGHDYFVLRGARQLLQRRRIDLVQFECNSTWAATGVTLSAAINFLREFGYRVLHLRPAGLFAVDFARFSGDLGYGNWVAFHEGSVELVRSLLQGNAHARTLEGN